MTQPPHHHQQQRPADDPLQQQRQQFTKYMQEHRIDAVFNALTKQLVQHRPSDPLSFLIDHLQQIQTSNGNGNSLSTFRKVVFVLGGPGSGKGTQCDRLVKELGMVHFSAGDLLRAETTKDTDTGRMISKMIAEGQIVPGHITIQLLRENIMSYPDGENTWFLVDGFPREMKQALDFEREVNPCQFVLFFECPIETLEHRLLERGKTSGRTDDNIESIRKRFNTYQSQTMPVIDYFGAQGKVKKIDSSKSVDEVFEEVKSLFQQ